MPAQKRRPQPALMRRLIEQPQQFEFFQAVRLIELGLRHSGKTLEHVLRCKNSVALGFPASQIEALSLETDLDTHTDAALLAALRQDGTLYIHITPAFMGLLGVSGMLPYFYTNAIAAQIYFDKNESGRAFLDSFSHRPMTLFYRAWEKCRVEYRSGSNGQQGLLPIQLALAGSGLGGQPATVSADKDCTIALEIIAHYAALIRHRQTSADMIVEVLNEYFGLPFRLEQFVGDWETLRPQERTCLGRSNRQLNMNTMLGKRYWRHDLCARLWIGPLSRTEFGHFLPGARGGKALLALLALFAVPNLRFEVGLILRANDIRPMKLNDSCQLGRGVVLATKPVTSDYVAMRYLIQF